MGDLLTTSYSKYSRNRNFGELLATTGSVELAKSKIKTTIEGINTVRIGYILGKKYQLDLPIVNELYKVIYKNKQVEQTIKTLFARKLKYEFYWYP